MKLCPVCEKLFRPGPYAGHMAAHVRRGEAKRVEVVRAEAGNVTRYQWARATKYVKVIKKG